MTVRRGILNTMDHSPAAEFAHLAVARELLDLHHEMDLLLATARTRGVNTVVEVVPPIHLDAHAPDRTRWTRNCGPTLAGSARQVTMCSHRRLTRSLVASCSPNEHGWARGSMTS